MLTRSDPRPEPGERPLEQPGVESLIVGADLQQPGPASTGSRENEALGPGGNSADVSGPRPSPKPPRGARWRTLLLLLIGVGLAFVIGAYWGKDALSGVQQAWRSVSGDEGPAGGDAEAASAEGVQYWTCGMHPWVILPEPGLCPICHMDLTPLDPAKLTGEIAIDPVVVQNIGVRVASVTTGPLTKDIRTIGTVAYDETATRDVNTKISGWIEELFVDETGAAVEQGDPLFTLYSPELFQAQEEYLSAFQNQGRLTRGLLEGSRTKLDYLDISPEQIRELEQRGTVRKTLTVASPHSGVVVEKNAHEGMKIEPGTLVYRIADVSSVWVIATLYEYQLPFVKVGQPAVMSLPYLAGREFTGEVAYIYPYLQEESRQVKVRLEFQNSDGMLRPGMFATVQLESTLDQEAILAPREAIISTGTRQVVFIAQGEGKFEPREVDIGVETEQGLVEILDGLKPGERVVTSGQFLLDSESKMRAALATMVRGEMAADEVVAGADVAEVTVLAGLPGATAEQLSEVLRNYTAIGDQLATDSTQGVAATAEALVASFDAMMENPLPDSPSFWSESAEAKDIRNQAGQLGEAKGLDATRMIYAGLSQSLAALIEEIGVPASYGDRVEALTCPMYPPDVGGAVWLQPAGKARNPYMGQKMLSCVGDRTLLPIAGGGAGSPAGQGAAAEDVLTVAPNIQSQIDRLVAAYLILQQMLYEGQVAGSEQQLELIRAAALELAEVEEERLRSAAVEISEAAVRQPEDLAKLRAAYKSLSAAVIDLAEIAPPTTAVAPVLRKVFCPMAKAYWLQAASEVQNPYYGLGSNMADCGTIEASIETRILAGQRPASRWPASALTLFIPPQSV